MQRCVRRNNPYNWEFSSTLCEQYNESKQTAVVSEEKAALPENLQHVTNEDYLRLPEEVPNSDLNDYQNDCRILVITARSDRLVSNVDGTVKDCRIAQVMRLHPNRKPEGPVVRSSVMSRRNPYRNHTPRKEAALTENINKDNEALHKNLQHVTNVANEAYRRLPVAKEEVPNSSALNGYRKDCCILVITGLPSGLVSNADGTVTDSHIARVMRLLSQIVTTRLKQGKEGSFEWKVKLHKMSDNPGKVSERLTAPFQRGNERDGKKSALPPFQLRGEIGRPMIFTLCGKDDLEALLSLKGSIWYNPLHECIKIGQFAAGLELKLEVGNGSSPASPATLAVHT